MTTVENNMKKPKQFSMPPLFKRDKDMLSIMNDPKKMKALKDVIDQAAKVSENLKHFKDLYTWYAYVITILPDFENSSNFKNQLETLINEYCNESERDNAPEHG